MSSRVQIWVVTIYILLAVIMENEHVHFSVKGMLRVPKDITGGIAWIYINVFIKHHFQ